MMAGEGQHGTEALAVMEVRTRRVLQLLPGVLLLISLGLSLAFADLDDAGRVRLWTLSVAAAGVLVAIERSRHAGRTARSLLYVGFVAVVALLVLVSPLYGVLAFSGYLYAFELLTGRAAFAGVAVTAAVTAGAQLGGAPWQTGLTWWAYAALFAVNLALAGLMSYVGQLGERRSEAHRRLADQLAEQLAENRRLQTELLGRARAAGVQEERGRIAREIHDTLAQGLAGVVTQLQAAEQAADDPDQWRRHHQNAADLARTSLSEARRSVHDLDPAPLQVVGLHEALASATDQWTRLHGVPVELVLTGDVRTLHPDIESTLLRAAQEALANVGKHAQAQRVAVTLTYMDDVVSLDVRDDGVGFVPAGVPAPTAEGGFGLPATRERVRRVTGSMVVESEPGAGTAVSVRVPAVGAEPREHDRVG